MRAPELRPLKLVPTSRVIHSDGFTDQFEKHAAILKAQQARDRRRTRELPHQGRSSPESNRNRAEFNATHPAGEKGSVQDAARETYLESLAKKKKKRQGGESGSSRRRAQRKSITEELDRTSRQLNSQAPSHSQSTPELKGLRLETQTYSSIVIKDFINLSGRPAAAQDKRTLRHTFNFLPTGQQFPAVLATGWEGTGMGEGPSSAPPMMKGAACGFPPKKTDPFLKGEAYAFPRPKTTDTDR